MRLSCECRKGARCTPCIRKESPGVFRSENVLDDCDKFRCNSQGFCDCESEPDLCVCGPVTCAQGVCECGAT